MNFKEEDFSRLKIPVHTLSPDDPAPLKKLSQLSVYPEFSGNLVTALKLAVVIRYLGVLYQENSPFLSINPIQKRKVMAARWAGFAPSVDRKSFKIEYLKVLRGQYKPVNKMAVRMCRIQHNTDFEKLIVFEEAYGRELEHMLDPKNKDLDKTRKSINALQQDIDEVSKRFFFDDDSLGAMEQLMEEVENEQLELSPEQIAMKLSSGEDPLGYNPYGNYVPEKLTIKKRGQATGAKEV